MNIFSVFTLLGGLAFFLYGMDLMSKSLEKMAGGKLEGLLKKMTSNPIKSLLLGIGITVAIQSSSAVTVMLVGLVNSGVMSLSQSIGVIMGSNIGTTITAWILSLAGLESSNMFVQLLKPKNFSPLLAFIGILLVMASKKQRRRDVGRVLIGFAVLMTGMEFMSGAVEPIADMPVFTSLFTAFSNPILGVLFGAVFMATDYVTSPMNRWAQIVYAIGIGVIIVVIRNFGDYPEGVTYAILLMNIAAPLLDSALPSGKVYGHSKKKEAKA